MDADGRPEAGPLKMTDEAVINLSGKAILVTGGARGLGAEMAGLFVRLGARVVIADIDGAAAKARAGEIGGGAIGVACDISDKNAVDALADTAKQVFGGVDALVNNAAHVGVFIIDAEGKFMAHRGMSMACSTRAQAAPDFRVRTH